ncbi:hypothetical protein K435DRAFT_855556 [Dendrothele bispora CBS 962.96]|uniref:Uncharacterized protein n=1 Tax=Dendrothele bispora (strain CBS 962.96) TaxID=1314807 RepID=A0A4S8MAS9_DENBC|nr:hypothetical protein K435DRAFT_855556 [Dendrothele bispora CBS 962.96]
MIIEESGLLKPARPPPAVLTVRSPSPASQVPPQFRGNYGNILVSPPAYTSSNFVSSYDAPPNVVYIFTPLPHNSMRLAPEVQTPGAYPPYHISVNFNCFTPSSYITSVRRNNQDGDIVGDFEYVVILDMESCRVSGFFRATQKAERPK